jgi:hypothetical protein
VLTRGFHALALAGSLTAVQFRYPAELPLNLNKIEHFSKASFLFINESFSKSLIG